MSLKLPIDCTSCEGKKTVAQTLEMHDYGTLAYCGSCNRAYKNTGEPMTFRGFDVYCTDGRLQVKSNGNLVIG